MVSKTFLLIALAFATVFLITSQVSAARELAANHGSGDVEDAKHDRDDRGFYNDGPGGDYNGGFGRYRNRGGRGPFYNGGGGRGPFYNGGGGRGPFYNGGGGRGPFYNGGGGHGGRDCNFGCCGGIYADGGCRCCSTQAEATAYKQTHKGQTHN